MQPRISTFAIGPYCNHFFLRQLAVAGRGAFDVAFRPHAIQVSCLLHGVLWMALSAELLVCRVCVCVEQRRMLTSVGWQRSARRPLRDKLLVPGEGGTVFLNCSALPYVLVYSIFL